MSRVFVAMSGGVDSSMAAALLVDEGHDVVGVTMDLWPRGDGEEGCCGFDAVRSAKRVCDTLGIPHYSLDFREVFAREVVDVYRRAYASGRTPNPCIVCNDAVKFSELLRRVLLQDADHLATGHYARIVTDEPGRLWLARGADPRKDQSYFLYRTRPEQLERLLFPVGGMRKTEVRESAARLGLPSAARPESQDACFLTDDDQAAFLGATHPEALESGPIVDTEGSVLGRHRGIARYTIGQRKGLGIASAEPLYVLAIRPESNEVVVGPADRLRATTVTCEDVVWRGEASAEVTCRIRYRGDEAPATATLTGARLTIEFAEPVSAAAPGQAAVCYKGDVVIGGGTIAEAQ